MGEIISENPNNLTKPLDIMIDNDEDELYSNVKFIYISLKGINNRGSGQTDQINEIKILTQHAPEKGSESLVVGIIDGNTKVTIGNIKNKNVKIFNSTDSFVTHFKKLLIK